MNNFVQKMNEAYQLSRLEKGALRDGLKSLFTEKSFSICKYNDLCQLAGVPPINYKALRVLHCIDYEDMSHETRQELFKNVMDTFRQSPFDTRQIDELPIFHDGSNKLN